MSRELDVVTISGKELDDLLDRLDQADEEVETMKANGTTAAFDKVNDQLAEANRENAALLADRDRLAAELARVRSDRRAWLTIEEMADSITTAFPNTSRLAALAFANVIAKASIAKGSRLSPSPQPATGAEVEVPDVAIPMGTALQRLGARLADLLDDEAFNNIEANYLIPAIRELETAPQPSADVVVNVLREALIRLCDSQLTSQEREEAISSGLDALRSSTNHDAQDGTTEGGA